MMPPRNVLVRRRSNGVSSLSANFIDTQVAPHDRLSATSMSRAIRYDALDEGWSGTRVFYRKRCPVQPLRVNASPASFGIAWFSASVIG